MLRLGEGCYACRIKTRRWLASALPVLMTGMRKRQCRQARHQGQQHNNEFYGAHNVQNLNLGLTHCIRNKHAQGYGLMKPAIGTL